MFVIRTVAYDPMWGGREDTVPYEWVFEDRADAQHKADKDNEGWVNHLLFMAQQQHRKHPALYRPQDFPTREGIAADFTEESPDFNYVEEWEFMPSTRLTSEIDQTGVDCECDDHATNKRES